MVILLQIKTDGYVSAAEQCIALLMETPQLTTKNVSTAGHQVDVRTKLIPYSG